MCDIRLLGARRCRGITEPPDLAKKVLLMSLSGCAIAVGARRFSKDVLPMVSALSNESREVRRRIVADIPHVRNHFAAMGRRSPDLKTASYALAEKKTRI